MKRILHQLRLVPMSPCYVWACVEIEAGAACGVEQVALVAKRGACQPHAGSRSWECGGDLNADAGSALASSLPLVASGAESHRGLSPGRVASPPRPLNNVNVKYAPPGLAQSWRRPAVASDEATSTSTPRGTHAPHQLGPYKSQKLTSAIQSRHLPIKSHSFICWPPCAG